MLTDIFFGSISNRKVLGMTAAMFSILLFDIRPRPAGQVRIRDLVGIPKPQMNFSRIDPLHDRAAIGAQLSGRSLLTPR